MPIVRHIPIPRAALTVGAHSKVLEISGARHRLTVWVEVFDKGASGTVTVVVAGADKSGASAFVTLASPSAFTQNGLYRITIAPADICRFTKVTVTIASNAVNAEVRIEEPT